MDNQPAHTLPAIRPALNADLPGLQELDRLCFPDLPYPRFVLRQLLDAMPAYVLMAGESPVPDGYILGVAATMDAWILSVAVRPDKRGTGLGTRLVQELSASFRNQGVSTIRLTAHPGEPGLVQWYQRLGFEPKEVEQDYFGDGEPRLLMEKLLNHPHGL